MSEAAAKALMASFSFQGSESDLDPEHLKERIERQNLIIQTLLVMLLEKGTITAEEFRETANRVDMCDGVRDGRLSEDKSLLPCPKCSGLNHNQATRCDHCGAALDPELITTCR